MTSVNQQDSSEKKELTPEEMEAMRVKMLKYYKEQLPLLEVQKIVESLSADIEEARLRRMVAAVRQAQIMAGPKEDPEASEETEMPQHKRTLKKTE